MPKPWQLPDADIVVPATLREAVGGHPLTARLLVRRGMDDPVRALAFLDPDHYHPTPPGALPGMADAVSLLRAAIDRGERVRIWGDFDADGQTATVVLYEALTASGAHVDYDLPSRGEGHGLHHRVVDEALRDGVSLLITCDTGIGDVEIIGSAVRAGLTVVITDHHDIPDDLPTAQAIVDPKLLAKGHPLYELSGVGVAYKVAEALFVDETTKSPLERTLDVVAIGQVADLVEQVDDVRYLIQRGMGVLRRSTRPGLEALALAAGLDLERLTSEHIGFSLGPRMNAVGRLADAHMVVELLLTEDPGRATELAGQIEALNRDRHARTDAVLSQVEDQLRREPQWLDAPAIVLSNGRWEPGVLGIVAGRLAETYARPAILIATPLGRPGVASARSVEGVDIHAAIESQAHLLIRQGGHPMAAGLSLVPERIPQFRAGLLEWLRHNAPPPVERPLGVDAVVPWDELSMELAAAVGRLEPFGPGNPEPVLATLGATMVRSEPLGDAQPARHYRLHLADAQQRLQRFIWFNAGPLPAPGDVVDVAFRAGLNHWRGQTSLQLQVIDWRSTQERVAPHAPRALSGSQAIRGSREVRDLRREPDPLEAIRQLEREFGDRVVIWCEGLPRGEAKGCGTRADFGGQTVLALGIRTPPPSPQVLRAALAELSPQVVCLLPPASPPRYTALEFVRSVAGMVKAAQKGGVAALDVTRIAARLAADEESVGAALEIVRRSGVYPLAWRGGLWALGEQGSSGHRADQSDVVNTGAPPTSDVERRLVYLLSESDAYRQAWSALPIEDLFPGD